MSLTSPATTPFRPEDKALDMLFPSSDDPLTDSISQYINGELLEHSEEENDIQLLGDLVDIFDKSPYQNGGSCLSSIGSSARHSQPSPQPWRKGLWCLNETTRQNDANEQHCTSAQTPRKDLPVSSVGVVGLGLVEQPCSTGAFGQTPPPSRSSSPPDHGRKKSVSSPRSASIRHHPYNRSDLDRKGSLSPHLGQIVSQKRSGMAYNELFHQEFQSFSLGSRDENDPISPPDSGRPVQPPNMSSVIQNQRANEAAVYSSQQQYQQHNYNFVGNGYTGHNAQAFAMPQSTRSLLSSDHISAQTHSQLQPIPSWTTDSYDIPSGMELSYDLPNLAGAGEGQEWWSPPHNTSSLSSDSHSQQQQDLYPQLAAPTTHRPTHHLIQNPPTLQTSGLITQYANYFPVGIHQNRGSTDLSSPETFSATLSPNTNPSSFSPTRTYPMPQSQPSFVKLDPYQTPRQPPSSPIRSPSGSPSRQRRDIRSASHAHSRRRVSASTSSAHNVSHSHRNPRKQRSISSISKPQHTPRKVKDAKEARDGFVNYTQDDKKAIVDGVAASGSSRTRERRAEDQRRKEQERQQREEKEKEVMERHIRDLKMRLGETLGEAAMCEICKIKIEKGEPWMVVGEKVACKSCGEGRAAGEIRKGLKKELQAAARSEMQDEEEGESLSSDWTVG
ncbi:MAG: hypothetical protein Q9227_006868 [Pyrenula ochraceoflavens]